jgi:hypothetical protein
LGGTFVGINRIGMDIPLKSDYQNDRKPPVDFVSLCIHFDDPHVRELYKRPGIRLKGGYPSMIADLKTMDGFFLHRVGQVSASKHGSTSWPLARTHPSPAASKVIT